jgi:CheY-like chemotaxis protein
MAVVLVADDDQAIRETLECVLHDAGYDVLLANDGAAALTTIRQAAQPLVVLLDHLMPRLDGFAVLRAVASDQALRKRHGYVLISAIPRMLKNDERALLSELDASMLAKPFDLDDLLRMVGAVDQRIAAH